MIRRAGDQPVIQHIESERTEHPREEAPVSSGQDLERPDRSTRNQQKAELNLTGQMQKSDLEKKFINDRADAIHNACEGLGTDEQAIFKNLSGMTADQRKELDQVYRDKYGMSLEDQLRDEMSGPELDRALSLLHGSGPSRSLSERADDIHHACEGLGTDEQAIFKSLSGLSPSQRKEMDQIYQQKYGMSLEQQFRSEMSGADLDKALALLNGKSTQAPSGQEIERNTRQVPDLGLGSKGSQVMELQSKLNEWLAQNGKPTLDADGAFGPKTQEALRQFQLAAGLSADRVAGPNTRAQLGL